MVIGLALLGLCSLPALAGLGGSVDSVQADSVHMRAQLRGSTSAAGYSIEELQLPSGTLLKEYVSPAGKVFAVSWHGPTIPDLRQTLGSYFHQYAEASSVAVHNVRTRRHFEVKQSDLVVQSSGRMRDFYGRAYVPSLLPPNVTAADIQ
ncbi:MAG: DUF2844 domain-containing protein [Steroidobacteraceae bacterium]